MQRIGSRRVSPAVLGAVLVGALNAAYIGLSLLHDPVRFDTAYNLTVSRNLANGLGFASDGLILRSGGDVVYADVAQRLAFDPSITTGPTVLVPLALAFVGDGGGVFLARALMCLWFVALVVGLALVGRRVAGRWGAVVAGAAPLLFDPAMGLVTEPRGPTEVIGEVPVAALVAAAIWCVARRPHVAALLIGTAVLTKLVAFLAAPPIVLAAAVVIARPTPGRVLVRMVTTSALVCAPLLCWQLVILLSLGRDGYLANLEGQLDMFRSGGSGVEGGSQAAAHVRLLAHAWTYGPAVLLVTCILAVTILALGAAAAPHDLRTHVRALGRSPAGSTLVTGGAVVVLWLGWFVLVSSQSYPRYAYVPLVLGIALAASLLVRAVAVLTPARGARLPVLACGTAVLVLMGWQVLATLASTARPAGETLVQQREAARVLRATSPDDEFGYLDPAAFVSAVAMVADMRAVPALDRLRPPVFVPAWDTDLVDATCDADVVFRSPTIVICDVTG